MPAEIVEFLVEFKHPGLWGNVEDPTEFSAQKNSCGLCTAHCGYTLQNISNVFIQHWCPSAQGRLHSVKDLRLWQMSSGKSQWSGLRCYWSWSSALPLHRALWTLDSSRGVSVPQLLQWLGWCLSLRKWIYATTGNQKLWGLGTLPLADSPKTNVVDLFCSLAL